MAVSFKWRNEEEERREGNGVCPVGGKGHDGR
jgi:hypothetical protein